MSTSATGIKKAIRYFGFAVIGLLFLLALVAVWIYLASESRLQKEYEFSAEVDAPRAALIERGRQLAMSRGCADCHGDDFGGKIMLDEMPFARVVGTNLTPPSAGIEPRVRHEQLYRALRHGVGADSKALLLMPSGSFSKLSLEEIEALSAYLNTLPSVDHALPDSQMGPLGRALLVTGKLKDFLSVEVIDHAKPVVAAPPPVGSIDYGRHAAQLCMGCHGADFGGGPMTHGGPSAPPAANLTPDVTGLAAWSEADFIASMREGKRPDGSEIDGKYMPWRAIGQASDDELKSIYRYLQSVPSVHRSMKDASRQD
ncbi:hypothetical protein ASD77_17510 [Pseudoxanthomonas sp. Root65]|uniref:c-type cytochrome n=1 Tax=Pseudoxanthomonas sp. Root65 TaxID=1736576 RepID=UPI0006F5C055|nr:c-type cytochrome [Pseudoxanthomonas sp. Root65]KRA50670.1 hypothetical protein ASD77_17510 [Pseudoxanthomonas sp. Root65]